jgi:transcriptional regulator with XRE-family HTH domain
VHLAEASRFRQSWISNVEHGRRNPSWSNVVRLAARADALTHEPPDAST